MKSRGARALGASRRLALVERAVKPFVLFKLQPFGAVDTYVVRLRRFQRVLVSRSLGNCCLPEETYKTFLRRC